MINDLVSVIVPAHNAAQTVKEAVMSVLNQTYSKLEVIVVDDASHDDTSDIVSRIVASDSRVRPLKNAANMGAARSRNRAMGIARGRYVAFCDADDLWCEEKIELQLSSLSKSGCSLSFSDYHTISEQGVVNGVVRSPFRVLNFNRIVLANFMCCSSVLVDVEKTGRIDMPSIRHAEDYASWIRVMADGFTACCLKVPMVYYRTAAGSESSNKRGAVIGHWRALREIGKLGYLRSAFCMATYAFFTFAKQISLKRYTYLSESRKRYL